MPDDTTPASSARIVELATAFEVSQALYVVTRLGVATVLEREGATSVDELAARTDAHPDSLRRLIRALAPAGIFVGCGDRVDVTATGALLSEHHPHSLHDAVRMWVETHYDPFSALLEGVRIGRTPADLHLGQPFLQWIEADPARASLFSRAMASLTSGLRAGLFDGYRLPPGTVVADIGGADASVLVELLTRDPDGTRRGIVFDQPTVVRTATQALARAGLSDRVEVVAGDFFSEVPTADIYVLSSILHDWDDDACRRILSTVAAAAAPGAGVLIVEALVPDSDVPHITKASDLTMLGITGGKERTEQEYRDLLDDAGFVVEHVVATGGVYSVVEASRPDLRDLGLGRGQNPR